MTTTSFELYDYWQTVNAFANIYTAEKDRMDTLLLNRRKAELCALLQKVIKNELNEQEQLLLRLHWYQGKSKEEIASILGIDRSSVYRRYDKICETLYERLKYAMEYRYGNDFAQTANALLRRDLQKEVKTGKGGGNLQRLRRQLFLSTAELAALLSIDEARLHTIEADEALMTVGELKQVTAFFGVSVNDFLFSENERG